MGADEMSGGWAAAVGVSEDMAGAAAVVCGGEGVIDTMGTEGEVDFAAVLAGEEMTDTVESEGEVETAVVCGGEGFEFSAFQEKKIRTNTISQY